MKNHFEVPALRVLEMLREEAPNMKLSKAYDFVQEFQEMRAALGMHEFIIMMLLRALGVSDQGHLTDKEIATKMKDMPDEIWAALKLAINIHGGYACSPFTPKDWAEKALEKLNIRPEEIKSCKESQLYILKKEE